MGDQGYQFKGVTTQCNKCLQNSIHF